MKGKILSLLNVTFSLIFALGLNNTFRQLENIDSMFIGFLTLSSLAFIIGSFLFCKDGHLKRIARLYIISGLLVLFALAMTGLTGDIIPERRTPSTPLLTLSSLKYSLTWLVSIINFVGFYLFFYASFNLLILSITEKKDIWEEWTNWNSYIKWLMLCFIYIFFIDSATHFFHYINFNIFLASILLSITIYLYKKRLKKWKD